MSDSEAPLVHETVLKRRREHQTSRVAALAAAELKRARRRQQQKKSAFKRPETLVREYMKREHDNDRAVRKLRMTRERQRHRRRAESADCVLAVLVRDSRDASDKVKRVLRNLRLRAMNTAVFLRLDRNTEAMLAIVTPYVAFGRPSSESIDAIVRKRGVCRVGKTRQPLSDNTVVERALGAKGMVCVEDLVHELDACGQNFTAVASFFWPFKLTQVGGKVERHLLNEKKHAKGGEVDINAFLRDAL